MLLIALLALAVGAQAQGATALARAETEELLLAAREELEARYEGYVKGGDPPCAPLADACDDTLADAGADPRYNVSASQPSLLVSLAESSTFMPDGPLEVEMQCALRDVEDLEWRPSAAQGNAALRWQYYADQSGTFTGFPGIQGSPFCGTDYDPRLRAWYATTVTGPKDLAIVVPVVAADPRSHEAAFYLLDTLTYIDTALVVLYGGASVELLEARSMSEAGRAAMRAELAAALDGAAAGDTGYDEGLEEAARALSLASAAGTSGGCKAAIVAITDAPAEPNFDQFALRNTDTETDRALAPVIGFRFYGESEESSPDEAAFAAAACASEGLLVRVPFSESADLVSLYYEYFAAALAGPDGSALRWAELYQDGLGLGEMTTACVPVFDRSDDDQPEFRGVMCADIVTADLRGQEDFDEVVSTGVASMYADARACPAASYTPSAIERARELIAADVPVAQCTADDTTFDARGDRPLSRDIRISISVLIPLVLGGATSWALQSGGMGFVMAGTSALAIGLGLFEVYPVEKDRENLVKSECVVVDSSATPFRCCDIVNCQCRECGLNPSCGALVSNLEEGSCCRGYHCCETVPVYCTGTRTSCSGGRCTTSTYRYKCGSRCVRSVSNRLCESACGTCHDMLSETSVLIEGVPVPTTFTKRCGRDKLGCVDDFLAEHEPGTSRTCFYDKRSVDSGADLEGITGGVRVVFSRRDHNIAAIVFMSLGAAASAGILGMAIHRLVRKNPTVSKDREMPEL